MCHHYDDVAHHHKCHVYGKSELCPLRVEVCRDTWKTYILFLPVHCSSGRIRWSTPCDNSRNWISKQVPWKREEEEETFRSHCHQQHYPTNRREKLKIEEHQGANWLIRNRTLSRYNHTSSIEEEARWGLGLGLGLAKRNLDPTHLLLYYDRFITVLTAIAGNTIWTDFFLKLYKNWRR